MTLTFQEKIKTILYFYFICFRQNLTRGIRVSLSHLDLHLYMYIHVYMYIYIHTHIYVCMYVCIDIRFQGIDIALLLSMVTSKLLKYMASERPRDMLIYV